MITITKAKWDGVEASITYLKARGKGFDELTIVSADRPAAEFREAWSELIPCVARLFRLPDTIHMHVRQARFGWADNDTLAEFGFVAEMGLDRKLSARVRFTGDNVTGDVRFRDACNELNNACIDYVEGVREQQMLPGMSDEAQAAIGRLKQTLADNNATMTVSFDTAGTHVEPSAPYHADDESDAAEGAPHYTVMAAQFSSICPGCGNEITPGDTIYHNAEEGSLCSDCGEYEAERDQPIPEQDAGDDLPETPDASITPELAAAHMDEQGRCTLCENRCWADDTKRDDCVMRTSALETAE